MTKSSVPQPDLVDDDDADIKASEAPLLEHLTELRSRLIWCFLALGICAGICFGFAPTIYEVLLEPFSRAAEAARDDMNAEEFKLDLIFTGPLEFFFVKLKLALFGGFILSVPVIAYHLYRFVAPGLYKNERRAFLPFLVAGPTLFALGASFVYYIMLPLVMRFALSQEQSMGNAVIQLLPRVSEYLSLVMALILAFGISFQLPVILTLLGQADLIGSDTLRKGRKYAVVGILAFAAFFTPPDMISQVLLAGPVMLLYEISIWCVVLIERGRAKADAAADQA